MPRPGQIIPMWLHPHEEVYINDNSRYEDIAFHNNGPTFLNVFMSRKGVDNKLQYFDSVSDWINEYGLPDFRRYGQPGYNAYVSLSTGLATSQSMRIMPKDASHANVVLLAKYQEENVGITDGKANLKLKLKFVAKTFANVTDENQLEAYANSLEDTEPDEDGYITLPIMTFWSRGRGLYGNDYRVRISHDKGADKDNNYVNYTIELLTMENGSLEIVEAYNVSFFIDAIDPNSNITLYVNDVIDDAEGKGSKRFNVSVNYDNLEKIFNEYVQIFDKNNNPELIIEKVETLPLLEEPNPKDFYAISGTEEYYKDIYQFDKQTPEGEGTDNFAMSKEYTKLFTIEKSNPKYEHHLANVFGSSTEIGKLVTSLYADAGKKGQPIKEFYIIDKDSDNRIYKYNAADNLQALIGRFHQVETAEEIDAKAEDGHIYYVPAKEGPEAAKQEEFYIAHGTHDSDFTSKEKITALFVGTATGFKMPEGASDNDIFMAEKFLYKREDIPGQFNFYAIGVEGSKYIPNVKVIEPENNVLPELNFAVDGTIYELEDGSKHVKHVSEDGNAMWVTPEEPGEPEPLLYTMENWDIFGYNKFTKSQDPMMNFDGGLESVSVLSIEGLGMESGTDGSFGEIGDKIPMPGSDIGATTELTEAMRDEAIEKTYLEAFNGGLDKAIQSKRRAPVDLMLDANYPLSVKKAMVALAEKRYDGACHLDTNLIDNSADLMEFYNQIGDLSERLISFDSGMFKTSDPITGKAIPVTITLWLASKLPQHFNVYGNHTPLAGEEYATLSGYKKNTIRPIIDADDTEVKEKLYAEMHMNYIECIAENTYMRGTQQTSQNFFSDLSEENNMLVLLEIKRKIERLAFKNRYKWADPEELRLFQEACKEIFSSYQNTKCRTLELVVDSNKWEKTRYIVHVYLAVTFRTFQKRALIEIDVNPRA